MTRKRGREGRGDSAGTKGRGKNIARRVRGRVLPEILKRTKYT